MCHILFRRHWQYNRGVVHNECHIMYTLNIKGKRIMLTPINKGVVIETDLNKHISLSLS
jgi:hypothetical protein